MVYDPNKPTCYQTVYPNEAWGAFHGHKCTKPLLPDKVVVDSGQTSWTCKMHHPDYIKKRDEENSKRYRERQYDAPWFSHRHIDGLKKEIERLKELLKAAGVQEWVIEGKESGNANQS